MKEEILSGALRIRAEELEKQLLSPYATLSVNTRGRQYPMEKCPIKNGVCARQGQDNTLQIIPQAEA